MSILKNPKHEMFCQLVSEGIEVGKAYHQAGYKPQQGAAHRLMKMPRIIKRIDQLKDKIIRAHIDVSKFKVAELVAKSMEVLEDARKAGDYKACANILEMLMQCGGYMDSPTLYHEHLFGDKVEQLQQVNNDGEIAQKVGQGMLQAVKRLGEMQAMKTIDGTSTKQ